MQITREQIYPAILGNLILPDGEYDFEGTPIVRFKNGKLESVACDVSLHCRDEHFRRAFADIGLRSSEVCEKCGGKGWISPGTQVAKRQIVLAYSARMFKGIPIVIGEDCTEAVKRRLEER